MGVGLRSAVALAVLAPAMLATRFHAPWWQVFLFALAASILARLAWLLARARPAAQVPVLIGAAVVAVGGSAWVLLVRAAPAVVYDVEADQVAADLDAFAGRRARVHGYAEPGSLLRRADGIELVVSQHGKRLRVRYAGLPRDMLRDGMDVVVAGRLSGPVLDADQLLMM